MFLCDWGSGRGSERCGIGGVVRFFGLSVREEELVAFLEARVFTNLTLVEDYYCLVALCR